MTTLIIYTHYQVLSNLEKDFPAIYEEYIKETFFGSNFPGYTDSTYAVVFSKEELSIQI